MLRGAESLFFQDLALQLFTPHVEVSLWYFTVALDPYLFWVAAKSLIYSYPPECSQGLGSWVEGGVAGCRA